MSDDASTSNGDGGRSLRGDSGRSERGDDEASERSELSEEQALALVGDETRMRILKALGDATVEREGLPRLSYTELKEKAGIRDSGRFNYHLSKLEGAWILKKPGGYKLPLRGRHVYNALVAGSFTADATPSPFRLQDRCSYCGHRMTVRYTDEDVRLLVVCEFCGACGMNGYFPPNSLSSYDEPEAIVDAAVAQSWMEIDQLTRGQCYNCACRVEGVLHVREPTEYLPWGLDRRPLEAYVTFHCEDCTAFHYASVGEVVAHHPRVVGFCAERGLDVAGARRWNHEWMHTDRHTTVESTDPPRATVEVAPDPDAADFESGIDDDAGSNLAALAVTLDANADVVAVEDV